MKDDVSVESAESKATAVCDTCFYRCSIADGRTGKCRARMNRGGKIVPLNYGRLTALALDPIEKKPLYRFFPGSVILSAGSWGCNMRCPFCQNAEISQSGGGIETVYVSPEALAEKALSLIPCGNIGVAYTYNEPLVSWEYVRDASRCVHSLGMKNVVVTNGCVSADVIEEVLPYVDAMNIDLKGFTREWYRALGGDFDAVKDTIVRSAKRTHVELTTLIVPGKNDGEEEIRSLAQWVSKIDKAMPLHITRFFPHWRMKNADATPVDTVYRSVSIAREYLEYVYPGNC
ncbi:AmmeMemoRadiSam system radical SAM enzyme [Treponema parvum]|uniref:AmmeMemoRadiSam system radical SAM enzyme n=1 Tax=Treponema parvum TaxID=138851 RepID=A0A975F1I7_9SPIR|nr:AmmeMemoRadiSam system radical SAM enzyme [Treponema parvum]QTQ12678.1 AmmeMemoRadiSam system radical SAM enzyme [Treponema parvum]QTQ15344.1 AmmeMemoRadiSam system radical SAM enzyme [Treponema parvum]